MGFIFTNQSIQDFETKSVCDPVARRSINQGKSQEYKRELSCESTGRIVASEYPLHQGEVRFR